jgi:hypothetical protein
MAECDYTMSGKHMYTPKIIGRGEDKRTVLKCACGRDAPDKKLVRAQLKAVRVYQRRLKDQSVRMLNKLRKQQEAAGVQPRLPF